MKKFSFLLAVAATAASFSANAQINQTPIHSGGNQIFNYAEKPMATTGNMYLNEKYLPAKASNAEGTMLVRYNAYSDYFETTSTADGQARIVPKQEGASITLTGTNDTYVFTPYITDKSENLTGYLNVISDNPRVKIYRRDRIYLQEGKIAANSYQTSKGASYKRAKEEFYAKIGNDEAKFFDGKKDYAKLIPGKSKEILEYIKTNKLDLEKEIDLQKLADYTATLL